MDSAKQFTGSLDERHLVTRSGGGSLGRLLDNYPLKSRPGMMMSSSRKIPIFGHCIVDNTVVFTSGLETLGPRGTSSQYRTSDLGHIWDGSCMRSVPFKVFAKPGAVGL